MRRFILALVATVSLVACTQPTRAQVITALTDAQWGLAAACGPLQWVPAVDCDVASKGLTTAIVVAQQAPADQIKSSVADVVSSVLTALPADSRARPYLTYLRVFLGA